MVPFFINSWPDFGAILGSEMALKLVQEQTQKRTQKITVFEPILGPQKPPKIVVPLEPERVGGMR